MEEIADKNEIIDRQRIKLKRYEFAFQEILLFFKKPLYSYQEWLDTGGKENPLHVLQTVFADSTKWTPPVKAADKSKDTKLAAVHGQNADYLSPIEFVCLECMRLGLNFLTTAQKYVDAVNDGLIEFRRLAPIEASENESLALLKNTSPTVPESAQQSTGILIKQLHDQLPISDNEGDGQDIASANVNRVQCVPSPGCAKCIEIMLDRQKISDLLANVSKELLNAESKLAIEHKSKLRIQAAKDIMDQEIEELTSTLFDQANHMVIDEARARDEVNLKNRELLKTIAELNLRLSSREASLVDIKKILYHSQKYVTKDELPPLPDDGVGPIAKRQTFAHTVVSGYDNFRSQIGVDGYLFREFQESFKGIEEASTLLVMMAQPFIKRCILEDVEPTIGYSYISTIAQSLKRKVIDHIVRNQIEVQLFVPPKVDIAEAELNRRNSNVTYACKEKCYLCAITRDCEYQVRLGQTDKATDKGDWSLVCRFCRDRLTSAMDFFSFLAYIRQGHGKSGVTLLSLFRQLSWFRRRMHLARIGSCSLFETESSAVSGPTNDAESDKYITIIT